MRESVAALPTFSELTEYVHLALCEPDGLDPTVVPLVPAVLTRSGRPCGMVFHVEGPRLLRTSAVWAADENRILVYDSTGQRIREVRLSEAPEVRIAETAKRAA